MNKKIIAVVILASIVAVAAIGAYYALQKKQPATPRAVQTGQNQDVMGAQVITLTENGYEPSEVSIRKGETVTFKNTTGKLFWPASNLHPSHGIYPEFGCMIITIKQIFLPCIILKFYFIIILHIPLGIGHPPCNAIIKTNDDKRATRQRNA